MRPSQLSSATFDKYPAQARKVAVERLEQLRALPLTLLASLLREVCAFDWLFPAEQRSIVGQMDALAALPAAKRAEVLAEFEAVSIPDNLVAMDWVNEPKHFLESLTAWLWASSQIDKFSKAARDFAAAVDRGPKRGPAIARASVVVLPTGVDKPGYPLFRKLRAHGTFYENVSSDAGLSEVGAWMGARASKLSEPLSHFYIDGGAPATSVGAHAETLSWSGSAAMRGQILKRVARMTEMAGTGPEMARSKLAELSPAELGLHAEGTDGVMERFALSVLADGAGTQIFSTTFAQWGAREVLRRAEPATLVVRFGARRELQGMNDMLAGVPAPDDAAGSCLDADMGAYYTWINQQRLAGAEAAGFVALSQGRKQAVVIGPGVAKGRGLAEPASLERLLVLLPA